MTTEEIEREDAGTKKKYRVVYRYKTYKDGEKEIQSCILLPSGHPLFGVSAETKGICSYFPLPLLTAGHGSRFGSETSEFWWLIFGDEARVGATGKKLERLSLEDIKTSAVPQIVAVLEEGETDPGRFSRIKRSLEADA